MLYKHFFSCNNENIRKKSFAKETDYYCKITQNLHFSLFRGWSYLTADVSCGYIIILMNTSTARTVQLQWGDEVQSSTKFKISVILIAIIFNLLYF